MIRSILCFSSKTISTSAGCLRSPFYNGVTTPLLATKKLSQFLTHKRMISTENVMTTQHLPHSGTAEEDIKISDKFVEMFHKLIKQDWVKHPDSAKLRLTVSFGGCSGFEYAFTLDDNPKLEEDDCLFEKDDAKLVIDKESLRHVKGSTVDYKEELIKSSFVISDNPNSEQNCSCGVSFSSKVA